ncbi:MAG: hypothetical protein N2035_00080 [Chthoniobacterales bacterium]|nr:hypothetical protein [Chthoniobacterales bacterium]
MKKNYLLFNLFLLFYFFSSFAIFAESQEEIIPASATSQLRELIGRVVTVEGVVSRIGVSRDGSAFFVNFDGNRRGVLELIRFPDLETNEYTEDRVRLEGLVGKRIQVVGTLREYEGKLQIEIKSWAQIKEQ